MKLLVNVWCVFFGGRLTLHEKLLHGTNTWCKYNLLFAAFNQVNFYSRHQAYSRLFIWMLENCKGKNKYKAQE